MGQPLKKRYLVAGEFLYSIASGSPVEVLYASRPVGSREFRELLAAW